MLFRCFLGFCICSAMELVAVDLSCILAYLEFLAKNSVSADMVANHVSALKAMFTLYGLKHTLLDDQKVKYFVRSMRLTRPLHTVKRNIMSLQVLKDLVSQCDTIYSGQVFKAIFLIAFFGFLRISNLAPHAGGAFDPTRHLTIQDIAFFDTHMTLCIKWSKTLQTRDRVHILTLPRLKSILCPVRALKKAISVYKPTGNQPLFQIHSRRGWQVVLDSRIRKVLTKLNIKIGYSPHHFTFHTFRRSGATLAYNSHMPIQKIKYHGSWTSDCVWRYIQQDSAYSQDIAMSFAKLINA